MLKHRLLWVALVTLVVLMAACGYQDNQHAATPTSASTDGVLGSERQVLEADYAEACLNERGWDTVRNGIAIGIKVPPEQQAAYFRDTQECGDLAEAKLPPLQILTGEPYFEALLEAGECLQQLGHTVDEPPTMEVFLEVLGRGDPPWSPYESLVGILSSEQWEEANRDCPQVYGR